MKPETPQLRPLDYLPHHERFNELRRIFLANELRWMKQGELYSQQMKKAEEN